MAEVESINGVNVFLLRQQDTFKGDFLFIIFSLEVVSK